MAELLEVEIFSEKHRDTLVLIPQHEEVFPLGTATMRQQPGLCFAQHHDSHRFLRKYFSRKNNPSPGTSYNIKK